MAVIVAAIIGATGTTVVTEMIPARHLHDVVLPRQRRGTAMTVLRVDAILHLTVVVHHPLPDREMTTSVIVTVTGTWISAGGMIRGIVIGLTTRETMGTKEMAGAGTGIGIGPQHRRRNEWTRRKGSTAVAGNCCYTIPIIVGSRSFSGYSPKTCSRIHH